MRPKERIKIFLDLVAESKSGIRDVLVEAYEIDEQIPNLEETALNVYNDVSIIESLWEAAQDLRFSQVLVNFGYLPNIPGFWYYMEEFEILAKLGFMPRDYMLWGSNYDADMNRLPETIYKPICNLDTDHIKAILDGGWCKSEAYLKVFDEELKYRGEQNEF